MTEPSETPERSTREPQMTRLLDNRTLSRLERLRINSLRRFTDKRRGEHLAGRSGTSTEFSDYRDYVPGDDVRFVDWNIFARLNRPYLKLYHTEEEMHVVLLVDASSSMMFENKLERALQLAASFTVMGLMGTERVSAAAFNSTGEAPTQIRRCIGRGSMMKVFRFLEGIEGGGNAPVDDGIETFLKYHVGRGIAVILSDFLTFGDMRRAFNRLFSSGLETFGLQILGPSELDPEVAGDVRFVDCETAETLDVSPGELLGIYQEYREDYQRNLAQLCRQRSGRFVATSTEDSLEWVLFDLLRRRGWIV
ncbi:MAG TPA: DUF58 domain-containing protein [Planctomycetota bacterium]|nr:DUF58 domain-containing protein [Planctomycetota bacterium]